MTSNKKLSYSEQVASFLNNLEHPNKAEIMTVRKIILESNDRITEKIKWNAPSFCVDGDDRITFNLRGKEFFRLIFHCGAKVKSPPNMEPIINDEVGLLEWASPDRAILKFTTMNDVISKESYLKEIITKWIEATEN
jgi:hypothetical protein